MSFFRNKVSALLGLPHAAALYRALATQSAQTPTPTIGHTALIFAVCVACLPLLACFAPSGGERLDYSTILVGIAACISLLIRSLTKIPFHSVHSWKSALRLTHTAFGVGCLPAVLLVLFQRDALFEVAQTHSAGTVHQGGAPSVITLLSFVAKVAVWAALTEEVIYRGMLVSVARRWSGFSQQRYRDIFAIFLSGVVFGLAHLASWGPSMAIGLAGLGMGLATAYLATGELLLPVVVYHIIFDSLSLIAALAR